MGTRAAFWVGNPTDINNRTWLGCVAFDGYPEGLDGLNKIKTEKQFRKFVMAQSRRSDFADPKGGWPYPWADDIFLTDFTYAFFDGKLQLTCFHCGWFTLAGWKKARDLDLKDTLPNNVPAPNGYDRSQPDSIMILTSR